MTTIDTKQKMKKIEGEVVTQVQGGIMEIIAQLIRQFTKAMQEQNKKANEAIIQRLQENEKLQEQNKMDNKKLYFSLAAGMMSKFLHEDIIYLESNFTHEPQHSILDPDTTSPTSMIFTVLILTISSCGIFTSLLLLYGLYMDKRTLLIPWVATITVFIMVDVGHCIYIFIDHTLKINPLSAIVFTFDFFVGSLNVYALLCVISQYQELKAGRGRACDEQNQRIPSIHYSAQATATSFASTRKPVTYLETRPTPTQSPTGTGPRTSLATEEPSPIASTTRLGPRKSVKFEHPSQLLEPWTIEMKSPTLTRGTDTSPLIEPNTEQKSKQRL
ncbi:hypothetical protein FQA39_LY05800 [Lamprigera yunnana]|nr:hypothetical protein FQA39_LY05800 [Lamprigera yunnana]